MNKSTFSLSGRVAVVTGSSRGLGAAIALKLAAHGAKVVVNGFSSEKNAQKVVDDILAQGGEAVVVMADVTSENGCKKLIQHATDKLGDIDILVVNATPYQPIKKMEDYDLAEYESMLKSFAHSPFLLAKEVLPAMKTKGFGRIINITSEVIDNGITNYSAYVTAKGAQNVWSQCIAREVAKDGITVNNVAPGWIPVERHADEDKASVEAYISNCPAGKRGKPEDIANAVLFLASEEASFISGQSISVNGANTVN